MNILVIALIVAVVLSGGGTVFGGRTYGTYGYGAGGLITLALAIWLLTLLV